MFSSSKEHCIVAFSWSASSLKFNQLTADNEPALDTIGWMQGLFGKVYSPIRYLYRLFQNNIFLAPSRSPRSHFVCQSVCPSGTKLSRAYNLHLRAVWVGLRSFSGHSQVILRSVSGQSQVSLRSVPGLS